MSASSSGGEVNGYQRAVLLLPSPDKVVNLLEEFQTLRNELKFLDVALVCSNNQKVLCHSLVLATANGFWRGVLKSLQGMGFHGVDGSPVEILMPDLDSDEVEEFVNSIYDPDRYINCHTEHDKVFLLANDGSRRPEEDYTDLNVNDDIAETRMEVANDEFDLAEHKLEPLDVEDIEAYKNNMEASVGDDDEDEEEGNGLLLPQNPCQPGVYSGDMDAIVCRSDDDQMMVLLQKGERDSEVIHQAIHCLSHLVGFDFRRFYRKVMDEALGFHRSTSQITSNSVLCAEERKLIKTTCLKKMRTLRKEGGEIVVPEPIDEAQYSECYSQKSTVKKQGWFKSYRSANIDGFNVDCSTGRQNRKTKRLNVCTLNLKSVTHIGVLETVSGNLRLRDKLEIYWDRPSDCSPSGVVLSRTGRQFHNVMDTLYEIVGETVSMEMVQLSLKLCPLVAKTLAVEKQKIETVIATECLYKYTCNVCNAVFSKLDKNKFQMHKKDHDPTCSVCGLKFPTGVLLEQHKNASHRPPRKLKCSEGSCNFRASTQRALDNHTQKNHRDFVTCSKCGDIQRAAVIRYHEKHCGLKKPCPFCGKLYGSQHIKTHIQAAHAMDHGNCYPCDTCGKTFTTRPNLCRHVDRVHRQDCDKNYVCKTCGRGFMTMDAMDSHQTVHTGEKPNSCRYCDKKYKSSSTTRHHERTKHPEVYQHRVRRKKIGMDKYQHPAYKVKQSQANNGDLQAEAVVVSPQPSISDPNSQLQPQPQQGFPLSIHLPFGSHNPSHLHLPHQMPHQ